MNMTRHETKRWRRTRRVGFVALTLAVTDLLLFLPAIASFGGFSRWTWIAAAVSLVLLGISAAGFALASAIETGRRNTAEIVARTRATFPSQRRPLADDLPLRSSAPERR
jgi:hypothetical protein